MTSLCSVVVLVLNFVTPLFGTTCACFSFHSGAMLVRLCALIVLINGVCKLARLACVNKIKLMKASRCVGLACGTTSLGEV